MSRKTTDQSIVDIAIQTGFADRSHLTTQFRKHRRHSLSCKKSITPKKYREMSK